VHLPALGFLFGFRSALDAHQPRVSFVHVATVPRRWPDAREVEPEVVAEVDPATFTPPPKQPGSEVISEAEDYAFRNRPEVARPYSLDGD
jgi:hypothetical protein